MDEKLRRVYVPMTETGFIFCFPCRRNAMVIM